jgi:GNAT superfamily N-acetyltransferase
VSGLSGSVASPEIVERRVDACRREWVAQIDGQRVATLVTLDGVVTSMFVQPEHRRCGIMRALIEHARPVGAEGQTLSPEGEAVLRACGLIP